MISDVGLIGPLNVDLLITGQAPTEMEELTHWAGPSNVMLCSAGSAGYIAQDLAKFGLKTSLVSTLADDPFGDAILRIMSEAGLNMEMVSRQPGYPVRDRHLYAALWQQEAPAHLSPAYPPALAEAIFASRDRVPAAEPPPYSLCGLSALPDMWNDEMAALFRAAKYARA